MTFPVVKLLDWANRETELETHSNPFAQVVLVHLKALETRRDPQARRTWKFRLVRGLFERGFRKEDVRRLFRLIDWLMELPETQDNLFWNDIQHYQEERKMPFITTPERYGRKQGMLEGMFQAVEDSLRLRFGEEGIRLLPEIKALDDPDKYRAMHAAIIKAANLEEVRRACLTAAAPEPAKTRTPRKRR